MRVKLLGLVLMAFAAIGAEVPSGTRTEIRLRSAIKIATSKVNDPVDAVVIAPVLAGDRVVIAAGANVHGEIKEAKQAVKPEEQAVVQIQFDQLISARGQKAPL